MVKLHVKKGNDSLFLYETNASSNIKTLLTDLIKIRNGRLKVERLCYEIDELSKYGVSLPPNMQGLAPEQISDMQLRDLWAEKNLSSSDFILCSDPMGKRNGKAPTEKYAEVMTKTTAECKARISKKLLDSNICLTYDDIQECLEILRGTIRITYPMGLPSYEVIWMELEGKVDLTGMQASKEILDENTELWCCNKQLEPSKLLSDYVGKNEKSKLIVKLQKKGLGAPAREPALTEEQKKQLMLAEHRRRAELKKLEDDDDDSHLDSQWADGSELKKSFHGLNKIRFK